MSSQIKVLLTDDSMVVRRLVSAELGKDPELEILPPAHHGKAALAKIESAAPHAVVLDVEMPELDGLQTLAEIRKRHGSLPVIMFSTLTDHGAAATLEALALGADDYVAKPGSANQTAGQIEPVCFELAEKIKSIVRAKRRSHSRSAPTTGRLADHQSHIAVRPRSSGLPPAVVVIGVSTGGPNALAELLPALPADLRAPILIAQHMPPVFTQLLAERLATRSRMLVSEARAGEILMNGAVRIAPGDYHMVLSRVGVKVQIELNQGPRENSCRPSVDVLFRSAAEVYGPRVLAVVMTGMGQDGLAGSQIIRECGGRVIVQDEATSVVWGMPGFVARAGLADLVLPLPEMAGEIVRQVRGSSETIPSYAGARA